MDTIKIILLACLNVFKWCFWSIYFGSISAFIWAVSWVIAFVLSNYLIQTQFNVSEDTIKTTAAALTVTVIAGSGTKIFSYLLGCDTDFKNLLIRGVIRQDISFLRVIFSVSLLTMASFLIFGELNAEAMAETKIISADFIALSHTMIKIIFLLFLAQVIFSWPDSQILKNSIEDRAK